MAGEIVRLQSVSRVYGTGQAAVAALREVSVGFRAGSFTAVMGPSGSGKSTLVQCAAGLERPSAGSVIVAGTELSRLPETALTRLRRDSIGFVFQEYNLLPSLTAEQNVGLPLRLSGRKAPRATLRDALAAVGLADRVTHRPGELSGGERQRVAIARALVTRPAVLFADEPTGALDTASSRQVLDLLRSMVDEHGQTIVMVSHDPNAAARADRIVFLSDGRIVGQLDRPTPDAAASRLAHLAAPPC